LEDFINDNNTHGAFIQFKDGSTAFIDGIPDTCEHDSEGSGYHFVSFIGGGGMDEPILDTGQTHEEIEKMDAELRLNGKYISGGCVSCSKCGKPAMPPMF
jgi:hypothetical protein